MRESYLETGLDVLSDLGFGGLKLAEVCHRLGVTSGAFYHHFESWAVYGNELVAHWAQVGTVRVLEQVRDEADPRRRIGILIEAALALPYGAEAAIRVWSSVDPAVYEVQAAVDRQRFDVLAENAWQILRDERQAQVFATSAMYLLVGCEQATLPRVPQHLEWIAGHLLDRLDNGGFSRVADVG